jgi:O-antigen/teichoic acid export membrane protein
MEQSRFHPLRLKHLDADPADSPVRPSNDQDAEEGISGTKAGISAAAPGSEIASDPAAARHSTVTGEEQTSGELPPPAAGHPQAGTATALPTPEERARSLLSRTPISYFLNQTYGLWFFLSSFILTLIITHAFVGSRDLYGVYAVAMSAFNTIAYIAALGLEDATTTYVPRVLAEHGTAAAAALIRRLLLLRTAALVICMSIMLFALPWLAWPFTLIPAGWASDLAAGLRSPQLLANIMPLAFYVLGNGIFSLQTAVCASFMRMRQIFIIGGLSQLVLLPLSYLVLQLRWSVQGLLWLQAGVSLAGALVLLLWQAPLLLERGTTYQQPLQPVIRLGLSAWLTNLVSGALLKQTVIILLGSFAVPLAAIGYFNLSYQLGHTASLLMVTGFGGVAGSALAAAFVGRNHARLGRSWQALIKIETLLAAPVLVFSLSNAGAIAHILYPGYEPVGVLLAIFLVFQIVIRTLGTTVHQSTLYVVGRAWQVMLSQWLSLGLLVFLGILLIPRWGPAGALIADGLAQIFAGSLLLASLWRLLPQRYPLGYTLRLLLALVLAALPSFLLHPQTIPSLVALGTVYLLLGVALLLLIRPLTRDDLELLTALHPRVAAYLRRFARAD